jgi:hypothetical protein
MMCSNNAHEEGLVPRLAQMDPCRRMFIVTMPTRKALFLDGHFDRSGLPAAWRNNAHEEGSVSRSPSRDSHFCNAYEEGSVPRRARVIQAAIVDMCNNAHEEGFVPRQLVSGSRFGRTTKATTPDNANEEGFVPRRIDKCSLR